MANHDGTTMAVADLFNLNLGGWVYLKEKPIPVLNTSNISKVYDTYFTP